MPQEITAGQLAKRLGCSRQWVNQLVRRGLIEPAPRVQKLGRNTLYFFHARAKIVPKPLDTRKVRA